MSWFKWAAAVNPVTLAANALAFAEPLADYFAGESDRKAQEGIASADRDVQMAIANRNFQMQEDFAKQGVRWRVADAEAAGLHPLAALGVMPQGTSPVSVGTAGGPSTSRSGNLYRSLSSMGQNVSRALLATQTMEDRALAQAQLEKVKAETDYVQAMAAESRKRASMPQNPPLPDPYSGVSGGDVRVVPNMHQVLRGPNGYEVGWSDEMSRSMMSRPFSMAGRDLWDIMKDALRGTREIWVNAVKPAFSWQDRR